MKNWIKDNVILTVLGGSRGYNTFDESSDYDYRFITIPPLEYYTKLDTQNISRSWDKNNCDWITEDDVYYSINKFISLSIDCNPNILEILFSDDDNIIHCNEMGKILIDNRELFLSQKCIGSYLGYTKAQLNRLENHRKWILNPVIKPERSDYGLPDVPLYSKDTLKCSRHISASMFHNDIQYVRGLRPITLPEYLKREYKYMDAWENWKKYEKYLNGRNPERFKMEQKCLFDAKHGSHVIRLQNTCIELMEEGKLIVRRPEAEFLKTIKRGKISYESLIDLINTNNAKIQSLKQNTQLPVEPDYTKIHDVLQSILDIAHE